MSIALLADIETAENFQTFCFDRIETAQRRYRVVERYTPPDNPPWAEEKHLDKIVWIDPVSDLDCMMMRNPMAAWCGYVGVGPLHPAFGIDYDRIHSDDEALDVHGGLTYASFCDPREIDDSICHVPAPGREDRVWWLGFDTAHGGDWIPSMNPHGIDTYRDVDYMIAEVVGLAQQLARIS